MRKKNITRKANFRLLLGMGESLGIPTHSWLYLRFLSVTLLSQQTVRCFLFSCYNGIPSAALFPISTRPMARPISIQYISLTKFEISTIRSLLVSTNLMRMHFIHHFTSANKKPRVPTVQSVWSKFPVHCQFPDGDVIWSVSVKYGLGTPIQLLSYSYGQIVKEKIQTVL